MGGIESPKFICFYLQENGHTLAITPYKRKDLRSHRVPPNVYNGRGSFDDYVAAASQAEERMAAVVEKCTEYMETVQSLVEKDFSSQIDAVVRNTSTAVEACKEQCERVTAEYKEALTLFERQRPIFEEAQEKMIASIETGFSAEQELVRQVATSHEEKTVSLLQELSDSVDQTKEELSLAISEASGQSLAEFVKMKQANDALQTELAAVKSEVESFKEWKIKNEMLVKFSLIAAAIAAVASIVNLFI